ncbi:MAG: hypothetical protein ACERK9_13240, partial [Deltaproteobacteria bacterium]
TVLPTYDTLLPSTLYEVIRVWQVFADIQDFTSIAVSAPRGCTGDKGLAPWSRLAGAGSKTPQAASVKSRCGER